MSMTDALISKTEAMIKRHEEGYFDWLPIKQIMPELVAEIKRLREPPQEPDWLADWKAIENGLSVSAKKWMIAYQKAQNSWIVRQKQNKALEEMLSAKESLNNDLMANCNQLRDRCWKAESKLARWQQIAIKERSWLLLLETDILDLPLRENYANQTDKYHDRATKELNLRATQEAGYVERLEMDYLSWVREYYRDLGEDRAIAEAQAALEKIREGSP